MQLEEGDNKSWIFNTISKGNRIELFEAIQTEQKEERSPHGKTNESNDSASWKY